MNFADQLAARSVLQRVLAGQSVSELSTAERTFLERLAGAENTPATSDERPLWYWLRDGVWSTSPVHREKFMGALGVPWIGHLSEVLQACGVTYAPSVTVAGLLMTPITREALVRGVTTVLRSESLSLAAQPAMYLVAMAEIREAAPHLIRMAERGQSGLFRDEAIEVLDALHVEPGTRPTAPIDPEDGDDSLLALYERTPTDLALDRLVEVLGTSGWSEVRVIRHPALFTRYCELGGDLDQVIADATAPSVLRGDESNHVFARTLAAGLMVAKPTALVGALDALYLRDTFCGELRAWLHFEFGIAGCQTPLTAMQQRLVDLNEREDENDTALHERTSLYFAVALLRVDGAQWLRGEADGRPEDFAVWSAGLLQMTLREDANLLSQIDSLPTAGDQDDAATLMIRLLLQAMEGVDIDRMLYLLDETPVKRLGMMVHLLRRVLLRRGARVAALEDLDLLFEPLYSERFDVRRQLSAPMLLARWAPRLTQAGDRGVFAVLAHARQLPASAAVAMLECIAATIKPNEPALLGLVLAEIACIEQFQRVISAGTAAQMRVHQGLYGPEMPLTAADRCVALVMLANAGSELQRHVLSLVQHDALLGELASTLALTGHLASNNGLFNSSDQLLDQLRAHVQPADRLSTVLHLPEDIPQGERVATAAQLMASPRAEIRAIASELLFTNASSDAECTSLRRLQLFDPSEAVQAALLRHAGAARMSSEEVRVVLTNVLCVVRASGDWMKDIAEKRMRMSALEAVVRLRSAEFLDFVWTSLGHPDEDVVSAAQQAAVLALENSGERLVLFSLLNEQWICERYGLPRPSFQLHSDDERQRSLKLTLEAMEARADTTRGQAALGRRMVLSPVKSWPPPPPSGVALSQTEFEALSMHVRVVFVDQDSGSIVAEVGDEPTGEIFSAMFETSPLSVMRVVWS